LQQQDGTNNQISTPKKEESKTNLPQRKSSNATSDLKGKEISNAVITGSANGIAGAIDNNLSLKEQQSDARIEVNN